MHIQTKMYTFPRPSNSHSYSAETRISSAIPRIAFRGDKKKVHELSEMRRFSFRPEEKLEEKDTRTKLRRGIRFHVQRPSLSATIEQIYRLQLPYFMI